MDELQKKISSIMNNLVNNMMDIIKKAEKEKKYPDLAEFGKEQANANNSINHEFIEARQRIFNKKGGWFK